jgi:hypothetical protein
MSEKLIHFVLFLFSYLLTQQRIFYDMHAPYSASIYRQNYVLNSKILITVLEVNIPGLRLIYGYDTGLEAIIMLAQDKIRIFL